MTASQPALQARPQLKLIFEIEGLEDRDYGSRLIRFEFKATVNSGYAIIATLYDSNFNLLTKLIEQGYLDKSRQKAIYIRFQLKTSNVGEHPRTATTEQRAIILSLHGAGDKPDEGHLKFVAIDPASWYLSKGTASGAVYEGKVSTVIRNVIAEYAPTISLDIGETIDSDKNKWWMMRQDPQTFIASLTEWSSSITKKKTHWIVTANGDKLTIKEQAEIQSKPRAYYTYYVAHFTDSIISWKMVADNALSLSQTKIVTQGCSAVVGEYMDKITDQNENTLVAKDSTTPNKQVAKVKEIGSFKKPPDHKGEDKDTAGWSSILATPEIYSAGDIGLPYDEYIDGRPRTMWLKMTNNLLKCKFRVFGHGEWSSCDGLGTDTIFIQWFAETSREADTFYFMRGNWLVYGFHHVLTRKQWYTDIFAARFDSDSIAKKVGEGTSEKVTIP